MKWLRNIALGLVVLAVVLVGGGWLLVRNIDRQAVMARAAAGVKATTGRDFAIDGEVHLKLFPKIALVAEGVRLGNAAWGSRPDMVRVAQIEFDVALRPLLSRHVEIERVEVSGADVLLETNEQGQGNWNFARADGSAADAAESARQIVVTLNDFFARDSVLAFRSGRTGHEDSLKIDTLTVADAGVLDRNRVDVDGVFRAQKVHLEGQIGKIRTALAGSRSVPMDITLAVEGASATVKGDIDLGEAAGQARMHVEAALKNLGALERIVGVPLALPLPANVKGDLTWQPRELLVEGFGLETQGQSIGGRIVWDRVANPPALDLALRADSIDLARLYPAGRTATKPDGLVLSAKPFPAIHLPAMNIKTDLHVERLVLTNGLELTSVQAKANSQPARVDVPQLAFGLARGTFNVTGALRAAGSEPPRVDAQIQARGVAMDALLALLRREPILSGGRTEMDAKVAATGSSLHAMADSLDGEIRLRMGPAQSVGKRAPADGLLTALLHALTPFRGGEENFKITCAAARLPVRSGNIVVDRSIGIEGERMDVVLSGAIDLGSERIDLAMHPIVKKGTGLDPSNFAGVVKIAGTFSKPAVQVNLAGTAREAVTIGAAVATSGITIVGGRLLGRVTDAHPCQAAYNGNAKTSAAAGGASTSAKKGGLLAPLKGLLGQ